MTLESAPIDNSPTMLHLPEPTRSEKSSILNWSQETRQFRRALGVADRAMDKLHDETRSRTIRLRNTVEDLVYDRSLLKSSITAGTTYLKFQEELSVMGVSEAEIFDFYKRCLQMSLIIGAEVTKDSGSTYTEIAAANALRPKILDEEKFQPEWFHGNRQEWRRFLIAHSHFHEYLIPRTVFYGETVELGLPEWFVSEGDTQLPNDEDVRQEIANDQGELSQLEQQGDRLSSQVEFMMHTVNKKYARALTRFERQRREMNANIRTFADLIYYLKATENTTSYPSLNLDVQYKIDYKSTSQFTVVPEKSREQTIQEYGKSTGIVFSKEILAFWLEQQLRGTGLATDLKSDTSQELIDLITPLLKLTNFNGDGANTTLSALKQHNKKAFNSLNFEIGPILSILSQTELDDIAIWLNEQLGNPINDVIWYITDIVSDRLMNHPEAVSARQVKIVLDHIKDFSAKWIRHNWNWAHSQLEQLIRDNTEQQSQPEVSPQNVLQDDLHNNDMSSQEIIRDIESTIEEIREGNLSDWHLRYASNKRIDDALIEISGSTTNELEESFRKFVAKNGISCSIKPESVIHTLDWLVTVPQHVENIRIRETVNGQVFKKIKRGNVRIFYHLDSEKRDIVFFIYQKQALKYDF